MEYGIIILFFLFQGIKIVLNWKVYNCLHSYNRVKPRPNYTGMWIKEDYKGLQKIFDSDFMFIYCNLIPFWLKIPKDRIGKVMAWAVLGLTIGQIVVLYFAPWKTV